MPKYKVLLQQYVEEIAEIEIEADTPVQAIQLVRDKDMAADADWQDGTDSYAADIYAVMLGDEQVWER